MNNKTPCECPLAGYCNRHEVNKNAHLHKLCQTNIKYFNLWEKCKGPLQSFVNCITGKKKKEEAQSQTLEESTPPQQKEDKPLPSMMTQAKNLASATAAHVKDGLNVVSDDQYLERLKICEGCEYMRTDRRCAKCGCFLDKKAKWRSSSCPIGKWSSDTN